MPTPYLTVEEVAERFRLTPQALYTQRLDGKAPGVLGVRVGRRILWRLEVLDAWFEAQQKEAHHAS